MILELDDFSMDTDGLVTVTAVVDEMVLVHQQTLLDPAEYGPALCRGTFYLSDEDLIPATDAELARLFYNRIDDWEVLHPDD
jgi:hypothetical protein